MANPCWPQGGIPVQLSRGRGSQLSSASECGSLPEGSLWSFAGLAAQRMIMLASKKLASPASEDLQRLVGYVFCGSELHTINAVTLNGLPLKRVLKGYQMLQPGY